MLKRLSAAVVAVVMLLSMMCTFVVAHAEGEPMELTVAVLDSALQSTEPKVERGDTFIVVLGVKNYMPCSAIAVIGDYDRTKFSFVASVPPDEMGEKTVGGIRMENPNNTIIEEGKVLHQVSWTNATNMTVQSGNAFTGLTPITNFNLLYFQFKALDDAEFGESDFTFKFDESYMRYYTEESGNTALIPELGTQYVNDGVVQTMTIYCDHDFTDVEYTLPAEGTAMEDATHSRVCTKCAQTITEDCAFDEGVVTDPTHTEDGFTTYTCAGCKYAYVVVDDGSATGHEWGEWVHDAELGAEEQHTHTRKCADFDTDGGIETKDCTFDAGVYTDPTCLEDGYTTYTCTGCGFAYDVIDEDTATGHNYTNAPYISDENGKHYQECVNGECNVPNTPVDCDYSWDATDKDHKCDLCEYTVACEWSDWAWNNKATRAESKHSHTCTVGGTAHVEEVACDFDDGVVTNPTHTEDGYTTFECQTCTSVCVEAGDVALGHTWGDWAHDEELGENDQHTHTRLCVDNDGGIETKDCTFDAGVYTDPTCEEDGYTTYTCTACGYAYDVIDEDSATGHDYSDHAYKGLEGDVHKHISTCVNGDCEAFIEVPCSFGEWSVAEAATREETGIDERFCVDCEHRDTKVTPKVAYFELTAPDPEAVAGKEWTVDVAVKNNPGLGGFVMDIAYDADTMTLTDAVKGTLGDETVAVEIKAKADGTAKLVYACETAVEGEDSIVTLTFTMSDDAVAGNYDVTVSTSDAVDGTEEVLPFEVESDTYTLELIEFIWGDVTDNGVCNVDDALYLLRYLAGLMRLDEMEQPKAANTTDDDEGIINVDDALLILRYLAGLYDPENPTA